MAVWSFPGAGCWVFDGIRIDYDPVRLLVNLMVGNYCLDQMSIHEYEKAFGFRAASELTRA